MHLRELLLAALLMAAQCAIDARAATCATVRINGDRPLALTCQDGSCGLYQVDPSQSVDLGFGGSEPDVISFEFYKFGGTPELGAFDLASAVNANYATCEQCVLIVQDFVSGEPQKYFFQTGGTLKADGASVPGVATELSLIWSNLHLVEVTIDPVTFDSTPVPNGSCYDVVPEVVQANDFEPSGYDAARCAAIANTLDIAWNEVDGATCTGVEHTDGSLVDAADGRFLMNGVSVTNNCLGTASYSFTLSPDRHTLYGSDTAYGVPMTLTLSNDGACFVGHWTSASYDFVAMIWNFAGP